MEPYFDYAWKSIAILAFFCALYHFLLRKLTFFTANRYFLLTGLVLSILLPLVTITQVVYVKAAQIATMEGSKSGYIMPKNIAIPEQTTSVFEIEQAFMLVYAIMVVFFLGKMIIELASLRKMLKSGVAVKRDGIVYVTLSRKRNSNKNFGKENESVKLTPFSFFNYICYPEDAVNKVTFEHIINHEKVHVQEWHSLDLLLSHLFRAFFWWNPFVWLLKKQIGENLEFIADAQVRRCDNSMSYERALLSSAAGHMQPELANNFFTPFIKQRIMKLQQKTSARFNAYKYALIVPALLLFLYSFNSVEKVVFTTNTKNGNSLLQVQDTTKKSRVSFFMSNDTTIVIKNDTSRILIIKQKDQDSLRFNKDDQTKTSGYLYMNSGTYYYVLKEGKTQIFNRFGVAQGYLDKSYEGKPLDGSVIHTSLKFKIDNAGKLTLLDEDNTSVDFSKSVIKIRSKFDDTNSKGYVSFNGTKCLYISKDGVTQVYCDSFGQKMILDKEFTGQTIRGKVKETDFKYTLLDDNILFVYNNDNQVIDINGKVITAVKSRDNTTSYIEMDGKKVEYTFKIADSISSSKTGEKGTSISQISSFKYSSDDEVDMKESQLMKAEYVAVLNGKVINKKKLEAISSKEIQSVRVLKDLKEIKKKYKKLNMKGKIGVIEIELKKKK